MATIGDHFTMHASGHGRDDEGRSSRIDWYVSRERPRLSHVDVAWDQSFHSRSGRPAPEDTRTWKVDGIPMTDYEAAEAALETAPHLSEVEVAMLARLSHVPVDQDRILPPNPEVPGQWGHRTPEREAEEKILGGLIAKGLAAQGPGRSVRLSGSEPDAEPLGEAVDVLVTRRDVVEALNGRGEGRSRRISDTAWYIRELVSTISTSSLNEEGKMALYRDWGRASEHIDRPCVSVLELLVYTPTRDDRRRKTSANDETLRVTLATGKLNPHMAQTVRNLVRVTTTGRVANDARHGRPVTSAGEEARQFLDHTLNSMPPERLMWVARRQARKERTAILLREQREENRPAQPIASPKVAAPPKRSSTKAPSVAKRPRTPSRPVERSVTKPAGGTYRPVPIGTFASDAGKVGMSVSKADLMAALGIDGAKGDASIVMGILAVASAVSQPEVATHNGVTTRVDGRVTGVDGLRSLLATFGPSAVRTLWVDGESIERLTSDAAVLRAFAPFKAASDAHRQSRGRIDRVIGLAKRHEAVAA